MKGLRGLVKEVLSSGICVACGACAGVCPHLVFRDGRLICLDDCNREEGHCYDVCPRTSSVEPTGGPIGVHIGVFRAKSRKEPWSRIGQYGGTASALAAFAVEEGLVSRAVLTSGREGEPPAGTVVSSPAEVEKCAGSRYAGGGCLSVFNQAAVEDSSPMALTVLPCQAQALWKMKHAGANRPSHAQAVGPVIGLFCTWALDYRSLRDFLTKEGVSEARSYDIPPPPAGLFQVMGRQQQWDFPLDRIRPMVMKGCAMCGDMTAEYADLSVGAYEGDPEWNTVIVRTALGRELVEKAEAKGWLECDAVPDERLRHLEEASAAKRRRAMDGFHGKSDE